MPAPAPWASARQASGWCGLCRSPETVRPSSRSIVRLSALCEGMPAGSFHLLAHDDNFVSVFRDLPTDAPAFEHAIELLGVIIVQDTQHAIPAAEKALDLRLTADDLDRMRAPEGLSAMVHHDHRAPRIKIHTTRITSIRHDRLAPIMFPGQDVP